MVVYQGLAPGVGGSGRAVRRFATLPRRRGTWISVPQSQGHWAAGTVPPAPGWPSARWGLAAVLVRAGRPGADPICGSRARRGPRAVLGEGSAARGTFTGRPGGTRRRDRGPRSFGIQGGGARGSPRPAPSGAGARRLCVVARRKGTCCTKSGTRRPACPPPPPPGVLGANVSSVGAKLGSDAKHWQLPPAI